MKSKIDVFYTLVTKKCYQGSEEGIISGVFRGLPESNNKHTTNNKQENKL